MPHDVVSPLFVISVAASAGWPSKETSTADTMSVAFLTSTVTQMSMLVPPAGPVIVEPSAGCVTDTVRMGAEGSYCGTFGGPQPYPSFGTSFGPSLGIGKPRDACQRQTCAGRQRP